LIRQEETDSGPASAAPSLGRVSVEERLGTSAAEDPSNRNGWNKDSSWVSSLKTGQLGWKCGLHWKLHHW
jgi:hypothetical protein